MKDQYKKEEALHNQWIADPLFWVKCKFGDNIKKAGEMLGAKVDTETGLTVQQEHAFREFAKLVNVRFKNHRGEKLTEEEQKYLGKIGISIMSGHFTGKDMFAALVVWYFLECFPMPKVLCTANTEHQLKNVLVSEISKLQRLSVKINLNDPHDNTTVLQYLFTVQSNKVFLKEYKGKEWFAEFITAKVNGSPEEQAETLAGRNAPFKLVVIDEASGVPDPVFKPLEGGLAGLINLCLVIFNPTRARGYAIETHKSDAKRWIALRWNAEESELVSKQHIKNMEEKYGRDSNPFRVRILGLPPLSESDVLIPWDVIQDAVDRDVEPLDDDPMLIGLDCGAGGDKSVLTKRKGCKVYPLLRNNAKDAMQVVGWAKNEIDSVDADGVFVDQIGLGHGITYRLLENTKNIIPVDSRARARNPAKYFNKRAEMYCTMAEKFSTLSIPKDEELISSLACIKFELDSSGRIKIVDKEKIKKELGHSPDDSDSLANTFAEPESYFRNTTVTDEEEDEERYASSGGKKNPITGY